MFTKKISIALIIAAMSIAIFAQSGDAPNWHSPAGSWQGVVTNLEGGPPPFRVLMTFDGDGGFVGTGDGDNAVGSPQHGVWERIGGKSSRTYAVTFRQLFYAPDATPMGLGKVRQTVILSESGDSWEGPFVIDILAPDGTVFFSGSGTASATRIRSEPLP